MPIPLSLIPANELTFGQDVALHGLEQLSLGKTRLLRELCIQGIDLKIVPMRFTRRAWPSIAEFPEIINTMSRSVLYNLIKWYTLG